MTRLWPVCGVDSEERHLADALGAVVLVRAGVRLQAVLACGGGRFAVLEDFFHQSYIVFYLGVLGGQLVGKVNNLEIV